MPTNETALVGAIVRRIRAEYPEAWWVKVHGSPTQRVGVPDLLVCVDGHLFAFEVKHQKPGESEEHARGRTTAVQLQQIKELREAGATAETVLSPEEAVALIEEWRGSHTQELT